MTQIKLILFMKDQNKEQKPSYISKFSSNDSTDTTIIQNVESEIRGKDYIGWGLANSNNFPNILLKLYDECAEHQTIVDGICQYVIGEGFYSNDAKIQKFIEKCNNDNETLTEVAAKCESDNYIFGGFCVQVIYDRSGNIAELYHVDISLCRFDKKLTNCYIADEWKWGVVPEQYNVWNGKINKKSVVYYYKGTKSRSVYPIPSYSAAYNAISTSIEISKFHLNTIVKGFTPTLVFNLNGMADKTDEEKDTVGKNIVKNFTGPDGSRVLTSFNSDPDHGISVEKISDDKQDEKFNTLAKSVRNTIYTAHRVTSPALFGVITEGQGFSKTEYQEAYDIFSQTVIKSYQNILIDNFKKILGQQFKSVDLNIKPFEITEKNNESNGTL